MAAHEPWRRYPRDLDGAWHAVDDLRDRVEAIELAAQLRRRLFQLVVGAAAVVVALSSVITLVFEATRR